GEHVVLVGQDYLKDGDTVGTAGKEIVSNRNGATAMPGMPGIKQAAGPGVNTAPRSLRAPATAAFPAHTHYTCIMHPQIDLDHPGNCPICGMKLVPKRTG